MNAFKILRRGPGNDSVDHDDDEEATCPEDFGS